MPARVPGDVVVAVAVALPGQRIGELLQPGCIDGNDPGSGSTAAGRLCRRRGHRGNDQLAELRHRYAFEPLQHTQQRPGALAEVLQLQLGEGPWEDL